MRFESLVSLGCATLLLAACGPPSDSRLQRDFAEHRRAFVRLADELSAGRALAVGSEDGRTRLAYDGRRTFEAPSLAELRSAGLGRSRYDELVELLREAGATLVERETNGVSFLMHAQGLVPSGIVTSIVRAERAPAAVVADSRATVGRKGRQCAPLEPGWWICREWD